MILKRALVNTATAGTRTDRKMEAESSDVRDAVRDFSTVAAHGVGRAVENGRSVWVFPVDGPVPIGLSAFVAAFLAKGFLIEPDEVAMEVKEETLVGT